VCRASWISFAIISSFIGGDIRRSEQHAGGLPGAIYKQTKGKQCPAFEDCAHRAAWLGRPFFNKVNGGCFSIHQQEATPFKIFNYITAASRSKLALVLRHQTVQAVQFFAYFLP